MKYSDYLENKISTVLITMSDLIIWSLICGKIHGVEVILTELEEKLKRTSDDGGCVFEYFQNVKNAVAILHEHIANQVDLSEKLILKSLDIVRDKIDPDQPKTKTQ